jgi:hypothetical protein
MLKRIVILVAAMISTAALAQVAVRQSIGNDGYGTAPWEALAKNQTGLAARVGSWRGVKTAQIIVTAAGEQSIGLQGSMNNVNWITLHGIELDSGEYLSLTGITASTLVTIIEDPLYVRPIVSNEMGATAVDIDVIIGAYAR